MQRAERSAAAKRQSVRRSVDSSAIDSAARLRTAQPLIKHIMSNHRVRHGDVFAVPVPGHGHVAGIVLHISKRIRTGMLTGYFDSIFTSLASIAADPLLFPFVQTPNYTSTRLIETGQWPFVKSDPDRLASLTIPILRIVNTLYLKDEVVGRLPLSEAYAYPELVGDGYIVIETMLRQHFDKPRQ